MALRREVCFMLEKTKGVVLYTTAYNDKLSVVHIYTEMFGRTAYAVSLSSSRKSARLRTLFSPFYVLEMRWSISRGENCSGYGRYNRCWCFNSCRMMRQNGVWFSSCRNFWLGRFESRRPIRAFSIFWFIPFICYGSWTSGRPISTSAF